MTKIGIVLAAAALATSIVTACGSSGGEQSTSTSQAEASAESTATATNGPTITISGMAFGQPLTVAPGTQINIVNDDSVEHSVTADTGNAFDQDVEGQKKSTVTAPSQPGTYPFHCSYHPNMKGTLIVK
jgi:plastocyanin